MTTREQKSDLRFTQSIEPQAISAPAAGAGVDTQGFSAATIVVRFGDTVDAGTLFAIQESNDNVTFTDVTPAARPDLDVALLGDAIPVAAVANTTHKYAYVGTQRYVRVNVPTATTATDIAAVVILGIPHNAPV